ncbi:hypothetical protein [Bordetella genomosp. 13]|uniref:hypothetical protein n=1 Tax=Bordetella genomosp. 13 TaxID=463040 RepID=UPI0011A25CE4|nr:hypothetical protein [Bordetella genomosp. 13]
MKNKKWGSAAVLAAALSLSLYGCMSVDSKPANNFVMVAAGERAESLTLGGAVPTALSNGMSVTLPANSRWQKTGALPQGDVYRRVDGVFTIVSQRQEEAWAVVSAGNLIGFYYPVAKRYTTVAAPVRIRLEPR